MADLLQAHRWLSRVAWLAAGVVVATALVGGVAYAVIPSPSGVISGCYDKINGQLRIIDASTGATCRPSEKALSWSQTGPQGLQGPQGAPGVFSGQFASPNGKFSLSVTDGGITLHSPSNEISLFDGFVQINGSGYVYSTENVDYYTHGDRKDYGTEYHYGYEYHDGSEDHYGWERHFGEVYEGLYIKSVDSSGNPGPWSSFTFTVSCGAGNRVLAGGYTGGPAGTFASTNGPDANGLGWIVTLESTSGSVSFTGGNTVAYAVCSDSIH